MATIAAPAVPIGPLNSPKKLKHKSSKPIITWITRKLGGSHTQRPAKSINAPAVPPLPGRGGPRGRAISLQIVPNHEQPSRTVVLNDDHDLPSPSAARSLLSDRNSLAADSTWTKRSPALEADDDASIRPLPPTSPPSPTPSRSSSSQLSDPRTFRSGAASTKPTTIMSIEVGNGPGTALITGAMAHIAQFSSPSSPTGTRFSAPLVHPAVARAASRHRSNVQAPLHTHHHPRWNPNPTSPPADNASTLTLASSAFAASGRANEWADGISVSQSQYLQDGDVNSSHMGGEDEEFEEATASVRALRPRSSRRGSWESEESRWSARVGPNAAAPSVNSGVTRPVSISATSIARSLSIGKLKIGLGVTDEDNRRFSDATTAEKDVASLKNEEQEQQNPGSPITPSPSAGALLSAAVADLPESKVEKDKKEEAKDES